MNRIKLAWSLAGIIAAAMFFLAMGPVFSFSRAEPGGVVRAALLAGDRQSGQELTVAAYEQVLAEEGFPYQVVSSAEIEAWGAAALKKQYEAIVVPEVVNAALSPEAAGVIASYVREQGGHALLAMDPASRLPGGELRPEPLLSELAGVLYCMPRPEGGEQNYSGYWYFASAEEGREWGITPGKLDRENAVSSYSYGRLSYEHSRAQNIDARVAAFDRTGDGQIPVLTVKQHDSGGSVVYANLPLGDLKLRSDDLALRSVLRTFLSRYAKIPRLVNSPGGGGGVVFNLHICSGAYYRSLAAMLMQGLFQEELPFSIHVTAGPDTYKLGDGLGFHAESRLSGRPVLETLKNYGEIGSHGGWTHNFFAYNLHYLPQHGAFELLDWNAMALEAATGRKVVEYSAPGGNHPFWVNRRLEKMGIKAYYYAGDTGSSPTHPRLGEDFAGREMWAFPITPLREYASLEEMERGKVPPHEAQRWMEDLVEFAAEERAIRMVYTHPTDTRFGTGAIKAFEEKALAEQEKGRLTVAPMSHFADFLNRHARTDWQVKKREGGGYSVDLKNPDGLKDLTVAVYVGESGEYTVAGGDVGTMREKGWLYLTITSQDREKHLEVIRKGDTPSLPPTNS